MDLHWTAAGETTTVWQCFYFHYLQWAQKVWVFLKVFNNNHLLHVYTYLLRTMLHSLGINMTLVFLIYVLCSKTTEPGLILPPTLLFWGGLKGSQQTFRCITIALFIVWFVYMRKWLCSRPITTNVLYHFILSGDFLHCDLWTLFWGQNPSVCRPLLHQ